MAYSNTMVIIETHIFTKIIKSLITDVEYGLFQNSLRLHPQHGDVIRDSGGLRKVRWKNRSTGKRGGIRVIYYYLQREEKIYLMYAYDKTDKENLTKEQIKQLKNIISEELGK